MKLEEHRRVNCPELREMESRQMQRAVKEEWEDQIKWREKVRASLCFVSSLGIIMPLLYIYVGGRICQEREGRVSEGRGEKPS